jgi:hypothetical protein
MPILSYPPFHAFFASKTKGKQSLNVRPLKMFFRERFNAHPPIPAISRVLCFKDKENKKFWTGVYPNVNDRPKFFNSTQYLNAKNA